VLKTKWMWFREKECATVSPLRGCMVSHFITHRFRGGLRSFVPGGTGKRRCRPWGLHASRKRVPTASPSLCSGQARWATFFRPWRDWQEEVSPLRGLGCRADVYPTAPPSLCSGRARWATFFRPWWDWLEAISGILHPADRRRNPRRRS
jgi:hypothetical protein